MPGRGRTLGRRPASVRLRDGQRVTVREVRSSDEAAIGEFLAGLRLESRAFRFFSGAVDIPRMTHRICATGPGRLGLVALDESGAIVGHALSIALDDERAEVAVEIADELHGDGLGTILVERLAELAERLGIVTFTAYVLPENRLMLEVFRRIALKHPRVDGRSNLPGNLATASYRRFPDMYEDARDKNQGAGPHDGAYWVVGGRAAGGPTGYVKVTHYIWVPLLKTPAEQQREAAQMDYAIANGTGEQVAHKPVAFGRGGYRGYEWDYILHDSTQTWARRIDFYAPLHSYSIECFAFSHVREWVSTCRQVADSFKLSATGASTRP